jgi:hypothetical protein
MRQTLSPRWGSPFVDSSPTACAVGCTLAPLRGFPVALEYSRLTPWAAFLRGFAASLIADCGRGFANIDGEEGAAQ